MYDVAFRIILSLWFVFDACAMVYSIGKPRRPVTHQVAITAVLLAAAFVTAAWVVR